MAGHPQVLHEQAADGGALWGSNIRSWR
jgi:hypothetical protein